MTKFWKWVIISAAVNIIHAASGQSLSNNASVPGTKWLTLTGSVFDPNGAPARSVGVIVPANIPDGTGIPLDIDLATRIFTDENGGYSLKWWQRSTSAPTVVMARDVRRNLVATANIDQKSSNVDLHLQPGLTISFKVEDPAGNSITNAEAQLNMFFGNYGRPLTRQHSIGGTTDRNKIEFSALPAGFRTYGSVQPPGHGLAYHPLATNGSVLTNSLDLGVVVLKVANLKIAGQIFRPDGTAAERVNVMIGGAGQPMTNIFSDESGHFAFDACDGTALVSAYAPGTYGLSLNGRVQTFGGDTNVQIKLAPFDYSQATR